MTDPRTCTRCGGEGYRTVVVGREDEVEVECPDCEGSGKAQCENGDGEEVAGLSATGERLCQTCLDNNEAAA